MFTKDYRLRFRDLLLADLLLAASALLASILSCVRNAFSLASRSSNCPTLILNRSLRSKSPKVFIR